LSYRLLSGNLKIKICITLVLYTALSRFKTWFLILREEHRLRIFENKVLKRILRPKREKIRGGRRKMHKEELHNSYTSKNIIGVISL
jgi:hypothetical protein